ncbi:MAG: exodeoxyribonuclease V subunit gamma, partial [Deltaproteobacteria bacterium]|nr:exodeoxyribonuclease V subunit gamma [Deltaproteobacteria bacterium]
MPLHVHGHARVEHLASALARDLAASSLDPFAVAPIVVGSRGMERWLRHQLATAHGIAANLAFPFPRQALDGMALRILGVAGGGPWWQPDDASRAFGAERLTLPVWQALRARAGHPAFADAAAYLDLAAPAQTGVSARQWAFARQVGDVVDKLMHDRHREALRWARDPAAAGEHAWLAHLLGDVGALHDRSPARVRERLDRAQPSASHTEGHVLRLFCLSTLGPADRELLAALARHVPVVVYALAPSHQWWTDLRSNREAARALARAADVGERSRVLADLATQNALLGQLGAPSRDMQAWIEAQDYTEGTGPAPVGEPERSTALGWLQGWVGDAAPMDTAMPPELVGDGSVELLSCWGALRQAEVLRDRLLDLFQRFPGEVAPRDVLVMTPDAQRFAPLVAAVFARRGRGRAADGTSLELPAIPVHIADMGLRRTNPVAEALIAVLALAEGRVSAPAVFDLLELEAVQTRLGLQADDVADLRTLVDASGMRWGLDASDRGAAGQPELDQNTLEFGLERLACGVLMAPIAPGEVASAEGRALAPHPVE